MFFLREGAGTHQRGLLRGEPERLPSGKGLKRSLKPMEGCRKGGKRIYESIHLPLMGFIDRKTEEYDQEMGDFDIDSAMESIVHKKEKTLLERAKNDLDGDLLWGS